MSKSKEVKVRGRMSAYAYFVQTCREELKKKNPNENVVFAEFSRKCGEKWKMMTAKEKKRFDDMAAKDKVRYEKEVAIHGKPTRGGGGRGGKRQKDPNAPKRSLSAYFFFCNEERPKVRAKFPSYSLMEVAKELGKRWEVLKNRSKYEELAVKDKARYEKEMASYRSGGGAKKAAGKSAPSKKAAAAPQESEEESEEEEEDEDSD